MKPYLFILYPLGVYILESKGIVLIISANRCNFSSIIVYSEGITGCIRVRKMIPIIHPWKNEHISIKRPKRI